ncbi:MAG: peptidase C14, partial [Spirulinaceae cyanobacterium]
PPPLKPPTVPPPAPQRRTTGNLTPKQKSWQLWGSLTLLILALLGLLNLFRGRQNNPVVDVPPATDNAETDADNSDAIADAPTADAGEAEPSPPAPTTERDPVVGPTTLAESQAILAQARTYIQTNQASGFSRAIAEATKIPPRAPLYDEAQADIARWSEVILDIARGRANQGDFKGAIAAAQLIPTAQATVYQNAQQQIGQWQTQQRNVELIRTARRQIRHPQASSYNQAINTVRQIASGQPGYSQAQELIKVWSEQIYLIANSRAAREEYQQAITTAQLVPEGTPSYDRAQQAIARWQQNKP